MSKQKDWTTSHFKDRVDPSDPDFRLVELRLPHDAKGHPNYGPFEYAGIRARERIRRLCAVFLHGVGDLTGREADKILHKSHAVDDKISGAS
jgi:hypothetical protein